MLIQNRKLPFSTMVLLIFFSTFFLYLLTLSRNFTGDSIEFARVIEAENPREMFETHQVLMHPIGWVFFRLWQIGGWQNNALIPLQTLNAITGSLSVLFIFLICRQITKSTAVSLIVGSGFSISAGIWIFSTEAEFVTIPLASTLLVLWWLLKTSLEDRQRPSFALKLGIGVGLASMIYMSSIFLAPVIIAAFLMAKAHSLSFRFRQIFIFLVAVGLAILPIFLLVGTFVFDIQSLSDLQDYQLYGGEGQLFGGLPGIGDFSQGAYTFLRTFVAFPGIGLNKRTSVLLQNASVFQKGIFVLFYLGVMFIALAPIVLGFMKRKVILKEKRFELAIIFTWFFLYASFAIYWVPGDLQFWIPATVSWWLFTGIVLSGVDLKRNILDSEQVSGTISSRFRFDKIFVGIILLMALVNGFGLIFANHSLDNNQSYLISIALKSETNENDLILTTGGDKLSYYIPYFTDRKTISVFQTILAASNNKDEAFNTIEAEIDETYANGGKVFLVGVGPGNETWWDVLEKVDLSPSDFNRFRTEPFQVGAEETVFEVLP